ncbi:MAG TPA: hypothetical protein PLJ00_05830 [Chitinophagales bacterium]|nr:hypothetical protein [Chitinophagales bacterium]
MATNNLAPVEGIQAMAYMSALDADEPDVMRTLFRRRGDQWKGSAYKIIQFMGFEKPASQEVLTHFEDESFMRPIRVGAAGLAAGLGAAHATFNIPVDPLDVFTDGNGGTHLFARKGDQIMFPNKAGGTYDLQGIVVATAPGTPQITVRLLKTGWTTHALAAGDNIIILSGAFSEMTGQPKGTIRSVRKKQARMQIIKESWQGSGSEMTQGKWFKDTNLGEDIRLFYADGMDQVDYLMLQKIDGALLFGQEVDTANIPDPMDENTGNPVRTTKGAVQLVREEGNIINYPFGGFSIANFNQSAEFAEKERAGGAMMVWYGFQLMQELEDLLIDYTSDTSVSYVVGESNNDKMLHLGFRSIHKSGVTFLFKKLDLLSNPETFGAAGFEDKQNMALVFPVSKGVAYADADRNRPEERGTFGIRYKALGGYSRRMQIWETDGTGHNPRVRPILSQDIANLYSRSHIAFQGMCFNKWQLWQAE